jgi:hypothetical protein
MPFKIPAGRKVVIAGRPVIEELNVETATNVAPGRLVKKGTDADDIVVNSAGGNPAGWVGWDGEGCHPGISPATRDTAYAQDKKIPVVYGPGIILVGKLASGQNVTKDTLLVGAANGELTAAAAISVSVPVGGTNVTSDAAQPDLVEAGSIPPGGILVAKAKEDCDASLAAKDIIVESLI